MAYAASGLSSIATGNGFTLWVYTTTDAVAVVNTAAYFTGAAVNMLNVNDWILCTTSTGSTSVNSINVVSSNDGTTVDVNDGLVITATDSD